MLPVEWKLFTHVIFTSQEAVRYLDQPLHDKQVIAVGEATAKAVRSRGGEPLVANPSTQEGVMALLQTLDLSNAFLFFPHSVKARGGLIQFLRFYRHVCLPLYDTLFQKPEPVPDLDAIDEIVFTSPSTVEGFIRIFGALPRNKKLTAIGPITQQVVDMSKKIIMLRSVKKVEYLNDYRLKLQFDNGKVKVVDFAGMMKNPKNMFRQLVDMDYFKQVKCDGDTISWPNGIEICPDLLYREALLHNY